jgi:hypothetical protein
MCSACSGDDPRPEMFTTFGISSPKSLPIFAIGVGGKRKEYRTQRAEGGSRKPASTLGDLRVAKNGCFSQVRRWVHRRTTVNLGFRDSPSIADEFGGAEMSWEMRNAGPANRLSAQRSADDRRSGAAIEVRVSPDAIVEVYAPGGAPENQWDFAPEDGTGNEWEENRVAREEARAMLTDYGRVRRAQRAAAYFLFAALAALAVWFASR